MSTSATEQRQIENEMIFRRANEKITANLQTLEAMNKEDGNRKPILDDGLLLRFKCECSDENCAERIAIKLGEYQHIHADRSCFIIKPGHQVTAIEEVIRKEKDYSVVAKYETLPESAAKGPLNKTPTNNA